MTLHLHALIGQQIDPVIDGLAMLRIRVFRDWPYLYDGDAAYERKYLKVYRDNPRAIVVAAFDDETLVGAATGVPMPEADPEFTCAFANGAHDLSQIFYCAESVLLPEYRGQRIGHRFFDLRENHARALGLKHVAFCSVIRPQNHPARPAEYQPLDPFWRKRGYEPLPGVRAHFNWRDLGESAESRKELQFWMKSL